MPTMKRALVQVDPWEGLDVWAGAVECSTVKIGNPSADKKAPGQCLIPGCNSSGQSGDMHYVCPSRKPGHPNAPRR